MKNAASEQQLHQAHATIFALQEELAQTKQSLVSQTLALEQRVAEQAIELRSSREELQKTNSEYLQLTLELEDRVNQRTAELRTKKEEITVMSEQLMQAAKLAAVGELAASIAHELNNPLATISLRIESLLAQTNPQDPQQRPLSIVSQEVERMANLVASLLQFSRRSSAQISTLDVREELENALELIHYRLNKQRIELVKEFPVQVPLILADRQQLRQLFLNLYNNAIDAMLGTGGTLLIRVRADSVENQLEGARPPSQEVGALIIEISDTGAGIPHDLLPRLGEPFFTTKPEGKGTGLGLSICRRIVREHQGVMNILSDGVPGKGTLVQVKLPVGNIIETVDLSSI